MSTFATSSEQWGTVEKTGKYPVKIYTIDGVLIYQESNGGSNKDKQPAGGVITTSIGATSMMETIKNPIMFYFANPESAISRDGHTKDLWDYYWTSYSRGTDGQWSNKRFHNIYLNGYTHHRLKSIYDPCPYGFRIPTNGALNQFISNLGWTVNSYTGGALWTQEGNKSWFSTNGRREYTFSFYGQRLTYQLSSPASATHGYGHAFYSVGDIRVNREDHSKSLGFSVRCIELG